MHTVLITGVGRDGQVGQAVAHRLAMDGYRLVLVDRTLDTARARAAEVEAMGGEAIPLAADLSQEESVAALMHEVDAVSTGALTAVVHTAGGFSATGPVADTRLADWEHLLTINLRTAFLVVRATLPALRRGRGSLVLFSSESILDGAKLARLSAYAVAKSGVLTLARCVAEEEAANGVRANVLAPAAIRTASNVAAMNPDARFVEREDLASVVSWLCSPQAIAVTGQVLRLSPRS